MTDDFFCNSFVMQLFAESCALCAGISFASLLKSVFAFGKNKNRAGRFVSFCLFLTFAVLFYTVLIFSAHSLFWFEKFSVRYNNYYFLLGGVFAFGFLASLFWKIFLPLSIVSACLLTFFTDYLLLSAFGKQEPSISIQVDNDSQKTALSLLYCHIPDTFILPVKRNWFLRGTELPFEDKKFLSNPCVNFYLNDILLSELGVPESFLPPETNVFPALYSAKISFKNKKILVDFVRDL